MASDEPPKLLPRLPMSANGSKVLGLVWWVGVLWTEPVGLVVAERLPIVKPAPACSNKQQGQFLCILMKHIHVQ